MSDNVEWGEYDLKKLFRKVKVNSLKYKTGELPKEIREGFDLPALTAGVQNQGLNNYVSRQNATILKNVISISANGANTGATFYQNKEFTILQDAYAIEWIYNNNHLSDNQYLFLTTSITKSIYGNYQWTNKAGWEKIKNEKILLPVKNREIDFAFMESFIDEVKAQRVADLEAQRIAVLEAYLTVSGLKDYELTEDERAILDSLVNGRIKFKSFTYKDIFNNIKQGRRLKKEDQIAGETPFVMAGVTNTGIVNYVSNPVATFPANSITIDIFGNTFYRNFTFGAGDDTGVYWSTVEEYAEETMLFFATSMSKSLTGKFSYGKKLRSSQSFDLEMLVPNLGVNPDFILMDKLITAIKKLVIKDAIMCVEDKLEATKSLIICRKK